MKEHIMAKIDHTNCTHPRNAKGRAACRAAVARGTTLDMTPEMSASIDRVVATVDAAFRTSKTTTDQATITAAARMARIDATITQLDKAATVRGADLAARVQERMAPLIAKRAARH